jgi:hypothetical protein
MTDMTAAGVPATGDAAHINVREVVGLFASAARLDAAVRELDAAGIPRAAMSVLAAGEARNGAAAEAPRSARAISDDPGTPLTAFASDLSQSQAEGMSLAVPMEIGGFGAAWAVAAAGGALMTAIAATLVGGAVGAGLGALLYYAVSRRHAHDMRDQLARGGLILWVRVDDKVTEDRVLAVLRACDAGSVHTHRIDRPLDAPLPSPDA